MSQLSRAASLILLLGACGGPRVQPAVQATPAAPAPAEAVAPLEFPFEHVWTAEENTAIRTLAGPLTVPRLFTRLEAIGIDSLGIVVRCAACSEPAVGVVDSTQVVFAPQTPDEAADGTLAEFLLALRSAAAERNTDAVYPVMANDFTYSLLMASGRLEAFRHWQYRGYRALDALPELLDGGVVTQDGRIWTAPPQYLSDPDYRGLRTGFRREGDRWVWLYLVTEEEG